MGQSNVIGRMGMAMVYYGTFGSISCVLARNMDSDSAAVGTVLLSFVLGYLVKKTLRITFLGPDRASTHR